MNHKTNQQIHRALYYFSVALMTVFAAEASWLILAQLGGSLEQPAWLFWLPVVFLANCWFIERMDDWVVFFGQMVAAEQVRTTARNLRFPEKRSNVTYVQKHKPKGKYAT